MRPRLPWLSRGFLAALVAFMAIGSARAQAQGILEPLTNRCDVQTHRIVDVCSGVEHLAWSSRVVLDAYACQHVQAEGSASGIVCPGLDIQAIASSTPPCPIEVQGLDVTPGANGTSIGWPRLVCSDSYDLVRGVLGVPAFDPCDSLNRCLPEFYCQRPVGDCDGVGFCSPKPPACTFVIDPVCGCDGRTYGNSCEAAVFDVTVACAGVCPCPPACTAPEGCLDVGPVVCKLNDRPASQGVQSWVDGESPPPGQAFFYLVRAKGSGVVGATTYGFTSAGQERFFAGDCAR